MTRSNFSDDFIILTQKLMMARERSEIIGIAGDFNAVIERLIETETRGNGSQISKAKAVTSILKFTHKEISRMAITLKKEFIANGLVAHVLKRESGKNSYCYEIRYRSNGYNITASSTDLRKAKEKFLAKTVPGEIEKYLVKKLKTGQDLLEEVFDEWFMVKEGTVTEKTLKRFEVDFNSLPERLRKTPVKAIRTADIAKVMSDVKPRKYEELRTLFNGIFRYAVACGLVQHNPVALIQFKRAERQSYEIFSEEELQKFFVYIEYPKYERIRQAAYLLYFFGLRPCEIDKETRKEGDFLITRNRKRKNGKIEYKKIPIPKQTQGLIDWDKPLIFGVSPKIYYQWFEEIFGEKTPYSFRHTFSTICQQYVRPDIVDIWMGDSPQRLVGKVYTHFSDKFMREQMDLVQFPIL